MVPIAAKHIINYMSRILYSKDILRSNDFDSLGFALSLRGVPVTMEIAVLKSLSSSSPSLLMFRDILDPGTLAAMSNCGVRDRVRSNCGVRIGLGPTVGLGIG